ncbi:diguanylate cyclase [Sulfuricurvum sp.]|uniref:diguanylate cyclase n=1 Tax=Sulfuricurvum sp. TaxID=2025608 RepID=UPI003BB0F773
MLFIGKITLLKRTFFWLLSISVVTFVTMMIIGLEVRDTIRENGLIRTHTILTHKIRDIHTYTNQRYSAINNLKQLVFLASRHHSVFTKEYWESNSIELRNGLNEFALKNQFYDIFVITVQGDIVYTVKHEKDIHTNLFHGPYGDTELAQVFKDALKLKDPYISDFYYYKPSHDFAAFMAKPIVDNGKVIGVVATQIDNKTIQSVINDFSELGESGEVLTAISRNGKMMSANTTRFADITAYSYFNPQKMVPVDQAALGKTGAMYTIDHLGHRVAAAWGYQDDLRMGIAVKMDEYEVLKQWYQQMTTLFLLFISGVVIVIWMVVIALRSFAKPIQELTQYALNISQGNYKIKLASEEYDVEWKLLTNAFYKMTIDIDQKMTQLNEQNILLQNQKNEIEELNQNLESRIQEKSKKLQEYINIIDHYVITSQTDRKGIITYVSDAFCKISGYNREELIGKNHSIIRHPDMPDSLFNDLWETISSGKMWHGEIKNLKADGSFYWVDTTISPNVLEGEIIGYTAVRYDITDKKIIEELAITDPMTGLYNRRFYVKKINEEMNRIKRHDSSLALMMVDVDNFKLYNDTYGHQAGDDVLTQVSNVLKSYTSRSGEYAFRLGGEEFGVIVSGMSKDEYVDLANRIRLAIEALAILHQKNNAAPYVTISIGIAVYKMDSLFKCEDLYREADIQLYRAKERGRNQVVIRDEE